MIWIKRVLLFILFSWYCIPAFWTICFFIFWLLSDFEDTVEICRELTQMLLLI